MAQLASLGLERYNVPADGNCTFAAIADQLNFHLHSRIYDHFLIREMFIEWCDEESNEHHNHLINFGVSPEKVNYLRTQGNWDNRAGDIVVWVIANIFQIDFRVVHGGRIENFLDTSAIGPCCLEPLSCLLIAIINPLDLSIMGRNKIHYKYYDPVNVLSSFVRY